MILFIRSINRIHCTYHHTASSSIFRLIKNVAFWNMMRANHIRNATLIFLIDIESVLNGSLFLSKGNEWIFQTHGFPILNSFWLFIDFFFVKAVVLKFSVSFVLLELSKSGWKTFSEQRARKVKVSGFFGYQLIWGGSFLRLEIGLWKMR